MQNTSSDAFPAPRVFYPLYPNMHGRPPYIGTERRIVLAFDFGTTYSGVAYTILDPGKTPEINSVSRYPGQEAGDTKVQTVIHYDVDGKVLAIGADEAPIDDDGDEDKWEDIKPHKLEWFKLLMRPQTALMPETIPEPKLPAAKTIIDVYADYYRYLFDHARVFISQTHADGDTLWESVADNIDFVLSHPNGWEDTQHDQMRDAMVKAGLIPDTSDGRGHVTFVTEGEASFQYCVSGGLVSSPMEVGSNVMIIDAGGGTVDLSTYAFTQASPVKIEEIASPSCVFEGSVIVSRRATRHLTEKLRNSRFGSQEYIEMISDEFDNVTKKRFNDSGDSYVKFSNLAGDRDSSVGIGNGQIRISREDMRSFFDPSVEEIIGAIQTQQAAVAPKTITTYFLVGGFASNDYLHARLEAFLADPGLHLFRPEGHTNKAVAEGSVSLVISRLIASRVARFTYGIEKRTKFMQEKPSHESRRSQVKISSNGDQVLDRAFVRILEKGTRITETLEFRVPLSKSKRHKLTKISNQIFVYRGENAPEFFDRDAESFFKSCKLEADISDLPCKTKVGSKGLYYYQEYLVVLSFGLTELQAQLAWIENGVEYRNSPSIVYNEEDDRKYDQKHDKKSDKTIADGASTTKVEVD